MQENLISLQQYAIKHKLSTFAVVKLVNSGKLKTIKRTIDGEEREFVTDNTANPPQNPINNKEHTSSSIDYEAQYNALLAKYSALQEKYTALLEQHNNAKK